jgi:DNA-binding NtrC family response regulator
MIDAFLREAALGGRARRLPVTPEAMRLLAAYPWPGNVRELRSEVHRWAVFCDEQVAPADLAPEIRGGGGGGGGAAPSKRAAAASPGARARPLVTLAAAVHDAEQRVIAAALEAHGGNLSRTAKALAIERNTLKRKLRAAGRR